MQDKKTPGPLTPQAFAEMMQAFDDAGQWMSEQLRSKSRKEAEITVDDQDHPDQVDD